MKPNAHYSSLTKTIHWITAVLVVVAFISSPGGSEVRVYAAVRDLGRRQHETVGLCVLGLTLVRLVWRRFDTRPAPVHSERWLIAAAAVVEWTLYLLLFAVPATAIVGAWLEGHPLTFLGSVKFAPPIAAAHAVGASVSRLSLLGDAIMWVAGAHTAAALFHHYVLKDDALRSMLPRRRVSTT